jgi:hypothetical protein
VGGNTVPVDAASVWLYANGSKTGVAAETDEDGNYSVTAETLTDGTYDFTIKVSEKNDFATAIFSIESAELQDVQILYSDLTDNGFVDFQDLTILLANWNQNVSSGSGNLVDAAETPVDFQDLTVLLAAWTGPGGAGSPDPPAATVADDDTVTSTSMNIDYTFDYAVTGVDATDLELRGIGGVDASVGTPTNTSGNTWRFPVSGLKIGPVVATLAPDDGDILDPSSDSVEPMIRNFIAMPGVTFFDAVLDIDGSSTADTIIIAAEGTKLTLSGATVDLGSGDILASAVTSIVVDGLAGVDTLDLSGVTAAAFTGSGLSGNITVNGGSGGDSITGSEWADTLNGGGDSDTMYGSFGKKCPTC